MQTSLKNATTQQNKYTKYTNTQNKRRLKRKVYSKQYLTWQILDEKHALSNTDTYRTQNKQNNAKRMQVYIKSM